MSDSQTKLEADRQLLVDASKKGTGAKLAAYAKLSGPGWLQSAITLGGGSLSSSLFLGVLAGFSLLWMQPFAMVLGIIMLSAIGYVTMSTGKRPFQAINEHVNPVLGWGWAAATLLANMVWALPQYGLANNVLQQNLLPRLLGPEGAIGDLGSKVLIVTVILIITTLITWSYDRGGFGIKIYELVLKVMVALIVLCFGGVAIVLGTSESGFDWGAVWSGFVPDFSRIFNPSPEFLPYLEGLSAEARTYWEEVIVAKQRDILVSGAATAVGINMTFLFPYTLLKRGWGKEFRGLAVFDLSTGMFIPFVLATSCVVIAAANQFHAQPHDGLVEKEVTEGKKFGEYHKYLDGSVKKSGNEVVITAFEAAGKLKAEDAEGAEAKTAAMLAAHDMVDINERKLAASLVTRSAHDLAKSISPLTGETLANYVFGFGVLGMALSTITLLMLISGFVICEMFNLPQTGWSYRLGTLAAATGVLGPFLWGDLGFYLAVPTSVFGFMLLPVAYITFFLLMNQKSFLGEHLPQGGRRVLFNALMGISATFATVGSVFMAWKKGGPIGIGFFIAFTAAVIIAQLLRKRS